MANKETEVSALETIEQTKIKAVVDTNVLMSFEGVNFLKEFITNGNILIVPLKVSQELDAHNHGVNESRKFKARIGLRFIRDFEDKIIFPMANVCMEGLDPQMADSKIVTCAYENGASIITLDLTMRLIARQVGIKCLEVKSSQDEVTYKGYREILLDTSIQEDDDMFEYLKNYPENILDFKVNEYIIIRDINSKLFDPKTTEFIGYKTKIRRYNGEKLVQLKLPPKSGRLPIEAMNDLQECALDLLNNQDVPVKVVCGTYGSGKSYLTAMSSLYQVNEKENYGKVVLVRNNDIQGGKDVGYLPGSLDEKTDILFQSIAQHFPLQKAQFDNMRTQNKLETHVSYFIKGADISGYMIVDEAQDLTISDIIKIGTRVNDSGCITLVGDWRQTEGKYISTSGLVDFISMTKDNPLVGVVVLEDDVRSSTSKLFADLNKRI